MADAADKPEGAVKGSSEVAAVEGETKHAREEGENEDEPSTKKAKVVV